MTAREALAKLKSQGDEKVRKHNRKYGAGDEQFGVKHGDIRKLAQIIKTNHALAMELWDTGNCDAQLLAVLLMDIKSVSAADLDRLVRTASFEHVADWLNSNVVKNHPDKERLRLEWLASKDRWSGRAAWFLTSCQVNKGGAGLDLPALLDRIESEMAGAPEEVQWTMNTCLAGIGIHNPGLRKRAIAIGEKLGIYRDYPVSRGCTSPFAPIWINEMVRRRSA